MTMKFVFKILGYLSLAILNFTVYVVVFAAAIGMKPNVGMEYVKYKLGPAVSDSLDTEVQKAKLPPEIQKEFDKASQMISDERKEAQKQRDSLNIERAELEALKNEIQRLLARKDEAEEERMNKLAKIYDAMDKERVAEVLSQMEDSLIAEILPQMKSNNASLVLEYLQPQRSAMISKMLLEGN